MTIDDWMTVRDIAQTFRITPAAVRMAIHRQRIPTEDCKKLGRDWLIRRTTATKLWRKDDLDG